MIDDIKADAKERMEKSLEALGHNFNKIRTGRAHPSLLEGLKVQYYGSDTPLNQVANISVEDARTLSLTAWDKSMIPEIEKAIMKSDLGLNPATAGEVIRIPMPMLTEETRKGFIRQARQEAESARVSVRNARPCGQRSSASREYGSASASSPCNRSSHPMLLIDVSVSRWSSPSTRRRPSRASRK